MIHRDSSFRKNTSDTINRRPTPISTHLFLLCMLISFNESYTLDCLIVRPWFSFFVWIFFFSIPHYACIYSHTHCSIDILVDSVENCNVEHFNETFLCDDVGIVCDLDVWLNNDIHLLHCPNNKFTHSITNE